MEMFPLMKELQHVSLFDFVMLLSLPRPLMSSVLDWSG